MAEGILYCILHCELVESIAYIFPDAGFGGMVDLIKDFGAMGIFCFLACFGFIRIHMSSLLFSALDCVLEQGCNFNAKFDHALDHV